MSGGFTTTRGGPIRTLDVALHTGLAPDGGLFVPARLPRLRWPPPQDARSGETSPDRAQPMDEMPSPEDLRPVSRWAAPAFFPSVPRETLEAVVDDALDFPVPLVEVERGIRVLELFHGPTYAFKDVGARFMAHLLAALDGSATAHDSRGGPGGDAGPARRRTVLVATSGDTGGAVGSAFHGRPGFDVVALFPHEGITERQRRQMTTLGGNVRALAVRGTFDDCQRMAKEAFLDASMAERHGLTSANSINVGRLLPQAFYYLHAARSVEGAHFVVPAGNLGNLCAGLLAHRVGMPASGFTAATNENRAFVDYLNGSVFEPRASIATTSSAMDVGDPSNLERIVWLYGGDHAAVRRAVRGVVVDQGTVRACIAGLYARTGYVADPHTAVAYAAAAAQDVGSAAPRVVLATAHPAKFTETVEGAIGRPVELPPGLRALQDREEHVRTIEADLRALDEVLGESIR